MDMAGAHEDEIYSTMFSSLKHPVRRKILRMLDNKPMTFMQMVEELGVSSPNLTYHLESLGELVSKMDNDQYKLSSFGVATIGAMKGIEEVHEAQPKKRQVTSKWRILSVAFMIIIVLLGVMSTVEFVFINQLNNDKNALTEENLHLQAHGGQSAEKVPYFLQNISKIDISQYTMSTLSNTNHWRDDLGVTEEVLQYSLTGSTSILNVDFRFRDNHFSRYKLDMVESSPVFNRNQPSDVLQNAKETLGRYRVFSGDDYLKGMSELLDTVSKVQDTVVTEGNMKLQVMTWGGTVLFTWMYTEAGIDFQTKSLAMTFQNNILTTMTDSYYLFTVGNTDLSVTKEEAVNIAKDYVKSLTWSIEGKQVSGFNVEDPPIAVQLVPHTRGDSVALFPYWYVELSLDKVYGGGINEVTVGIYADTSQVADVQMLANGASVET